MTKPVPRAARRCAAHAWRLFARCRCAAGALRDDRSGNVTLIFALTIIPIVGAVAVAVDCSRGNAARTAMPAALDATTLMVSNEALDLKNAQVRQKAKSYFHAQFDRPDVRGLKLSFDMTTNGPGDFTIVGEATAKMDTALAHRLDGVQEQDGRAQGGGETAAPARGFRNSTRAGLGDDRMVNDWAPRGGKKSGTAAMERQSPDGKLHKS